jgi:hypothetical protein
MINTNSDRASTSGSGSGGGSGYGGARGSGIIFSSFALLSPKRPRASILTPPADFITHKSYPLSPFSSLFYWLNTESHVYIETVEGDDRSVYPIKCSSQVATRPTPHYMLYSAPYIDLFAFSGARHIANQITLIQHNLFCAVSSREIAMWSLMTKKGQKEEHCPNLSALISHFNRTALWVVTCVVTTMNLKERTLLMIKIIDIARHCLALQNFLALQAMVSAFHHASIARLTRTIAGIPPNKRAEMDECTAVMSPFANYSVYRQRVAACKPPLLPYIGYASFFFHSFFFYLTSLFLLFF